MSELVWGKIAYEAHEAFWAKIEDPHPKLPGHPPSWDELDPAEQEAWAAAAQAVREAASK